MLCFQEGFGVTNYQDEIQEHINEMLIGQMDMVIDCADLEDASLEEQYEEIGKSMKDSGYEFPRNMSVKRAGEVFVRLYSLLKSDKKWVPTIEMEFFLAEVIKDGISDNEIMEEGRYEPDTIELSNELYWRIPEHIQKDVIKETVLMELQLTEIETTEDEEEFATNVAESVFEELNSYTSFTETMLDKCFVDCDYEFLSDDSGVESRDFVNRTMFEAVSPEADEEYFLPEDWRTSTEFHFINRDI